MKILIISLNVGSTAPGLVFEKLIRGLCTDHTVDILTQNFSPISEIPNVRKIIKFCSRELYYRLEEFLITIFSFNPFDTFYARNAAKLIDANSDYDLIFSMIASGQTIPLEIGKALSKRMDVKHFTYFVDAIPAPIEWWMGKNAYYNGTRRYIRSKLNQIDGFFASNPKMLDYQLKMVNFQKRIVSDVIYIPVEKRSFEVVENKHNAKNIFLYTGNIYGVRSVEPLLKGFQKILKEFPDAILHFVGKALPVKEIEPLESQTKSQIKLTPFQENLIPFFSEAKGLIDIDADIENDVFLSSKMFSYLAVNKPIISITNPGSPSSELFKNLDTIIQCKHDSEEIYHAMKSIITNEIETDFTERKIFLEKFSTENIIEKLNKYLV